MISLLTGKPGGGKGLMAMRLVINELRRGKRHVITNLPIRLLPWVNGSGEPQRGLAAYMLQKYGSEFDCAGRVHILSDADTDKFYLFRFVDGRMQRADARIRTVNKDGITEERVMDYETDLAVRGGGVLYVIDEAWKFFGSRNWQKTGEAMIFYSAQHRHFGDDCFIVTQHTKQIDPAIHRVAQDYWHVTNHGNMVLGIFRQPPVFDLAIYDEIPTGSRVTASHRMPFLMDRKGIAQCYDTSAGVGIAGQTVADLGGRKRGLPSWVMGLVAVLSLVALYEMVKGLGWLAHKPFEKGSVPKIVVSGVASAQAKVESEMGMPVSTAKPVAKPLVSVAGAMVSVVEPSSIAVNTNEPIRYNMAQKYSNPQASDLIRVTGYCIENGQLKHVFLENGHAVNPSDVKYIGQELVFLRDGSYLPLMVVTSAPPARVVNNDYVSQGASVEYSPVVQPPFNPRSANVQEFQSGITP